MNVPLLILSIFGNDVNQGNTPSQYNVIATLMFFIQPE